MAYELRPDSGSAFQNDNRTGESQPHFRGSVMIGGVEYWHSIWKKKTKAGATWLSSSFQLKEPREEVKKSTPPADDFDDDIPW